MNTLRFINDEHFFDSDSNDVFDELIDHIGSLLAEEYFHIMEDERQAQYVDANRLLEK